MIERLEEIAKHAIHTLGEEPFFMSLDDGIAVKEAIEIISAQPEREKGNWVYGEDEYGIDGYHCDKCGFFVPWDYAHKFINYIEDYNFCPSCGADMRERDEQKPDDGI